LARFAVDRESKLKINPEEGAPLKCAHGEVAGEIHATGTEKDGGVPTGNKRQSMRRIDVPLKTIE